MRSLGELRVWGERALRAASLVILAMMLWRSLRPDRGAAVAVDGKPSRDNLRAWSSAPVPPPEARVNLDSMPNGTIRDWLGALRRSGTRMAWAGDLPATAMATTSIASPRRGTMVLVATPRGAMVVLQDDIGPFDSVKAASGGAQFTVHTDALLSARTSNASATAARHDSAVIRRVLVLGTAGWESKFTTAALEEAGWKVDELVHVAPGVDVSQNAGYHVDTTRYSAVVALDEAAAPWAAAIDEYVRSGGGVIIAPAAAGKLPATLRAAISGPTVVPAINDAPATLANIAFSPLVSVRSDAIVLDRRGNAVAIAARRHVAGRVIQIGYPESWRWRMAGTEQAVEEHRDWWSKLVSAAAYSPRVLLAGVASESDPAPYASLIAAIGPPVVGTIARMPVTASHSMVWMAVLVALTLVTEIASRRLRGAK